MPVTALSLDNTKQLIAIGLSHRMLQKAKQKSAGAIVALTLVN